MKTKVRVRIERRSNPLSNAVRIDFGKQFSGTAIAVLESENDRFERNLKGSVGILPMPVNNKERFEVSISTPDGVWNEQSHQELEITPIRI